MKAMNIVCTCKLWLVIETSKRTPVTWTAIRDGVREFRCRAGFVHALQNVWLRTWLVGNRAGGGLSYIFRTLEFHTFFPDKFRYHCIFTLSRLFRTCQAPGLAAEVDPIAHFGHFHSHLARSRPKLNYGAGRDFRVGPQFGATRKQPIIPGNPQAWSCAVKKIGSRDSIFGLVNSTYSFVITNHDQLACFHQIFSKLDQEILNVFPLSEKRRNWQIFWCASRPASACRSGGRHLGKSAWGSN